jgi:hypothetical protein
MRLLASAPVALRIVRDYLSNAKTVTGGLGLFKLEARFEYIS